MFNDNFSAQYERHRSTLVSLQHKLRNSKLEYKRQSQQIERKIAAKAFHRKPSSSSSKSNPLEVKRGSGSEDSSNTVCTESPQNIAPSKEENQNIFTTSKTAINVSESDKPPIFLQQPINEDKNKSKFHTWISFLISVRQFNMLSVLILMLLTFCLYFVYHMISNPATTTNATCTYNHSII